MNMLDKMKINFCIHKFNCIYSAGRIEAIKQSRAGTLSFLILPEDF